MAKSKRVIKAQRKAKKIWCPLIAPKAFGNKILGKSNVYEAAQLMNKPIKVNMMNLTGDMKSQNVNIGLKVLAVKDGQGLTDIWSYKIIPAHIKRLVRRKRDKIDDSFTLETKDKIKMQIKPLVLTLNKTSKAVRRDVRKAVQASYVKTFAKSNFEDLMRNIFMRKTQNFLKRELNKITPIRTCEIRVLTRLTDKQSEKATVLVPPKENNKPKPIVEKKEEVKKEETPAKKAEK